jgi:polar amino acid transport system substrate-binding protein
MKKILVALGLASSVLFTLLSISAHADVLNDIKKRGALRVCLEPAYMPFEITNKRGEIIGFDPDLAALMVKELVLQPF